MYCHCIYCSAHLGANDQVEHFPVSRRIAFDPEKGRLWAVCPSCRRWNLSPLEERWEALEECERLYRDGRLRVSTGNVGLCRQRDGTELVRIGQAPRPEFAGWRYGRRLLGRNRPVPRAGQYAGAAAAVGALAAVTLPAAVVVGAAAGAAIVGAAISAGASLLIPPLEPARVLRQLPPLHDADVRTVDLDGWIYGVWLRPARGDEAPWNVTLFVPRPTEKRPSSYELTGTDALTAMGAVLADANRDLGGARTVRAALGELQSVPDPARYFEVAEARARGRKEGCRNLWDMPRDIRLALEMALHEESERRALEGELAELERRWREAEEVAAIADQLAFDAAGVGTSSVAACADGGNRQNQRGEQE